MTRMSMARVVMVSVGTLAIVGCLLLAALGRMPGTLQALAAARDGADYIDSGVRIVPPSATSGTPGDETSDDSDSPKADVEGDEVNPALATYSIDRDGNLFELHSPHTEVPRLAGPTI